MDYFYCDLKTFKKTIDHNEWDEKRIKTQGILVKAFFHKDFKQKDVRVEYFNKKLVINISDENEYWFDFSRLHQDWIPHLERKSWIELYHLNFIKLLQKTFPNVD